MERTFHFTIPDDNKRTLLAFLKEQGFSRSILISMKPYADSILLNGKQSFLKSVPAAGDLLSVTVRDDVKEQKFPPSDRPLSILYEDEDLLVVNKAADMPIHPSLGNYENTLANAVTGYYDRQGLSFVFRCINRLDRDTTGAVLIAKNAFSAAVLSDSLQKRQIHRTYLAIVTGQLPGRGVISLPIGRVPDSVMLRRVDFTQGERAVTHYQTLESRGEYSLVRLHLDTGRTHQIRVHMKALGHPLPGDYLYNPDYREIARQPLHSWQLEFPHPVTKETICLTAPLPEDMEELLYTVQPRHS